MSRLWWGQDICLTRSHRRWRKMIELIMVAMATFLILAWLFQKPPSNPLEG